MPAKRPLIRRAAALAAAGGAMALSVRVLSRPRPASGRQLVDWEAVRATARARSGERSRLQPEEGGRLASDYDAIAAEMVPLMAEVCGAEPASLPPFRVLDREGFIDVNLAMVRRLLEPVERLGSSLPETALTALGRRLTSRYVGEVFGFMSQRVLGQYDPMLMIPALPSRDAGDGPRPVPGRTGSLFLVEPNVALFERGQAAPAEPLRRWLILHEATHAWQFESHPWLAEHLGNLMAEMLAAGIPDPSARGGPRGISPEVLRRLRGGLAGQLRGIGRVQAIMSVLEGYSNVVMHRVGRSQIEDFDALEAAFHRRQKQRTLLERLALGVTGIAVKLRQYEAGERFCEALIAAGGYPLLNRVWDGPQMMPTMAEIRSPGLWISRVRQAG